MSGVNQAQVLGAVRWLIAFGGGYAVGNGYITADQLVLIGGAAAAVVPLVWSLFVHSDAGAISAAKVVIDKDQTAKVALPVINALRDAGAEVNTAQMTQVSPKP